MRIHALGDKVGEHAFLQFYLRSSASCDALVDRTYYFQADSSAIRKCEKEVWSLVCFWISDDTQLRH